MVEQNWLALAVVVVSVLLTVLIAHRRAGQRGGSAGSHRPIRHTSAMVNFDAGRRIPRSGRRIIPPARSRAPRGPFRVAKPAIAPAPVLIGPMPSEPRFV